MKAKLTQANVRTLPNTGGKCIYWDSSLIGLGLRVNGNGSRQYVCRYRCNGRERLGTVGDVRALTLEQARQRVLAARLAAKDGRDPFADKRSITFAQACALYIERHAKPHKKSWRKDERRLAFLCQLWGSYQLADITTDVLQRWHISYSGKYPYAANRYLELIKGVYAKLETWGIEPIPDPTRGIKHNREFARERWLDDREVARLLEALDAEPHRLGHAAIRVYLFTGMRKSELQRLTWEMLSDDCRALTIPDTKNGRTLRLPLPDAVASMLQGIKEEREPGTTLVFHSYLDQRRALGIDKLWRRVRERAGLHDVRLHDLRRTVASMLFSAGYHEKQIGKILNHKSVRATESYTYLSDEVTRAALQQVAERIGGKK